MDNLINYILTNQALVIGFLAILVLINTFLLGSLSLRLSIVNRELMALNAANKNDQHKPSNSALAHELPQPQQATYGEQNGQGLPDATLIEKAIARVKAGASVDEIQSELKIDRSYLEILLKQHSA